MPSLIGAFGAGYERARDAEITKKKNEADIALRLASQNRELLTAAEKELDDLDGFLGRDDWDPSMTPEAIKRAARIDRYYGPALEGRSATARVMDMLHLHGTTKKEKVASTGPHTKEDYEAAESGSRGYGRSTAGTQQFKTRVEQHPLSGWQNPEQKTRATEQAALRQRAKNAHGIQLAGYEYLKKNAFANDGTGLIPAAVPASLLRFESEMIAATDPNTGEPLYNIDDVREATKALAAGANDVIKAKVGMDPNSDEFQDNVRLTTKDVNTWIERTMGESIDGINFTFDGEKEKLANMMRRDMAPVAAIGMDAPVIQGRLIEMYMNDDGTWNVGSEGVPATPYAQRIKRMTQEMPEALAMIQEAYDTKRDPEGNPLLAALWEPHYMPVTGNADYDAEHGGLWMIKYDGSQSLRLSGPRMTPGVPRPGSGAAPRAEEVEPSGRKRKPGSASNRQGPQFDEKGKYIWGSDKRLINEIPYVETEAWKNTKDSVKNIIRDAKASAESARESERRRMEEIQRRNKDRQNAR